MTLQDVPNENENPIFIFCLVISFAGFLIFNTKWCWVFLCFSLPFCFSLHLSVSWVHVSPGQQAGAMGIDEGYYGNRGMLKEEGAGGRFRGHTLGRTLRAALGPDFQNVLF